MRSCPLPDDAAPNTMASQSSAYGKHCTRAAAACAPVLGVERKEWLAGQLLDAELLHLAELSYCAAVQSFGTEGRRKDGTQLPRSDQIFPYVVFKGASTAPAMRTCAGAGATLDIGSSSTACNAAPMIFLLPIRTGSDSLTQVPAPSSSFSQSIDSSLAECHCGSMTRVGSSHLSAPNICCSGSWLDKTSAGHAHCTYFKNMLLPAPCRIRHQ